MLRDIEDLLSADSCSFVGNGPPALDSERFLKDMKEVQQYGRSNSYVRVYEHEKLAQIWACFDSTVTPPGHWNDIAGQIVQKEAYPLSKSIQLFHLLNLTMADAGIYTWQAKYYWHFWRPETVITYYDGNQWKSFLDYPAHHEYPSGHSAFSGAAAEILTLWLNSDYYEFSIGSGDEQIVYHSFAHCVEEVGNSRVYGGIHFRFSCKDGAKLGKEVAQRAWASYKFALQ